MAYFRYWKCYGIYIDDNPHLSKHILSLSTNASHEDDIVFIVLFPPQGIISSASNPEIPRKIFFMIFTRKGGLILLLQEAAFEIGNTY